MAAPLGSSAFSLSHESSVCDAFEFDHFGSDACATADTLFPRMKALLLIFTLLADTWHLDAQTTPPPIRDPFVGFGGTALDRGKRTGPSVLPQKPVPPGTAAAAGLKLSGNWDARNSLSRGGSSDQSRELASLLKGFAAPGTSLAPSPATRIYRDVTYLLPFGEAQTRLGIGGKLKSGGKNAGVGFPDGIDFVGFSPEGGRPYEVRLLYDKADQVIAVEFTASDPRMLPPPPEPLLPKPDRLQAGRTYDFVPQGTTSVPRSYPQALWNLNDYVLIQTRGGPRVADLYLPKPMVSLILHCLDAAATR